MRNWDMDLAFAILDSLSLAEVAECEAIFNIGNLGDHCYKLAEIHSELEEFFNRCANDGFCTYDMHDAAWMATDIVKQRFTRVNELLTEEYYD